MTDPKTFTGPKSGVLFDLDADGTLSIHYPGSYECVEIPIADLNAFIAERGQHYGQHARCLDCLRSPLLGTPEAAQARAPTVSPDGVQWAPDVTSIPFDPNGARGYKSAVGRTVGSYEPDAQPELCASCAERMAQARAEGKAGIVLCGTCAQRANPPAAAPEHSAEVRWQAARLLGVVLEHHDIPDARQGEIQESIMAVLEGRDE